MDRFLKTTFGIAAVLLLGIFIYLVLWTKDGQVVSLIAFGLCLIASRFGDVISLNISATGVAAQMRDAIDEARATIDQLHTLAEEQARASIELIYGGGRWGGRTRQSNESFKQRLLEGLRKLGMPEERVQAVGNADYPLSHFDYYMDITRAVPQDKKSNENFEQWNGKFREVNSKGIGHEPSADELTILLKELDAITPEVSELLEDYKHYEQTKQHRRKDIWLKSNR